MKKSIAIGAFVAVMSVLVLLLGAQAAHTAEGTANANASASVNASTSGIGPDSSFLYFLEIAIDRINLALTFDHSAKAEKGLKIAEKRLIEVKEMVEENKLDAARKAQREHDRVLATVEKSIRKIEKLDEKAQAKLESELEEHENDAESVKSSLELHIKVNGKITPDQQAIIDSIRQSLQNRTDIMISIQEKGEKTRERAEERINASASAIADVRAKLQNASVNSTAAVKLVSEAEIKLHRARQAFNESKFGEAFGQATAAGMLARNADKILSHVEEIDEDIETAQVLVINAKVVGNQTEVSVMLGFVSNSTNASVIAQQIRDRLSNLSKENISSLLVVQNGSSLLGERLAVEAKIIDGFAVVKSKYRFDLNTTNTTDIVNGIYDKLSALTTANISSVLVVKAGKAEDENEREIEVEVKRGIAHIKIELNGSEFKYSIPFTNETDLFSNISAKTGLSLAEVSSITELEVKESSKSSGTAEVDEESEEEESD